MRVRAVKLLRLNSRKVPTGLLIKQLRACLGYRSYPLKLSLATATLYNLSVQALWNSCYQPLDGKANTLHLFSLWNSHISLIFSLSLLQYNKITIKSPHIDDLIALKNDKHDNRTVSTNPNTY